MNGLGMLFIACVACLLVVPTVIVATRLVSRLFAICMWRYRHLAPWPFCWRIAVEGLLVSLLVGIPMIGLGASNREMPRSLEAFIVSSVLLAPWLETLIFQSLPIGLLRFFNAGTALQAMASIVPFFLAHLTLGAVPGIAAGLIGGFYLAVTYIHWRRRDWWTAFWVTSLSHALRNGLLVVPMLLSL